MVDMGNSGRDPVNDYKVINNELKTYGFGLDKRPYIILASKMDEEGAEERLKDFKKHIKEPIIPISALTEEGIEEAMFKCADLLEKTPLFPLYSEDSEELDTKVYELPEEEKPFSIEKVKAHEYRITGDQIVKFYRMTNISTDEGMMVLMTRLRKLRVDDELEKMGAEDGDIVWLDDFSFEYVR